MKDPSVLIALAIFSSLFLICFTLWLNRENWSKNKRTGTTIFVSESKTEEAEKKKTTEKKDSPKKAVWWKWTLGFVGIFVLLWMGFGVYKHFSPTTISKTTSPALLGVVDVPGGEKWSDEIQNPQRAKITWGRIDWSKGGTCEVMLNRDPKKVTPITTWTHIGPTIIQFKCSEAGARVEVFKSN